MKHTGVGTVTPGQSFVYFLTPRHWFAFAYETSWYRAAQNKGVKAEW